MSTPSHVSPCTYGLPDMFCPQIRRAHSNTRTQSVRRTSIREKTLTPKKEAQEEARIRLQLESKKKPMVRIGGCYAAVVMLFKLCAAE